MLRIGRLRTSRVIHLTEFGLRGDSHHVTEIDETGGNTRNRIHPVERKSLLPIKIDEVSVHAKEQRRTQYGGIGQRVASLRQALKGVSAPGLQRLQILPQDIK